MNTIRSSAPRCGVALLAAAAAACCTAFAQSAEPSPADHHATPATVVITGNPLGSERLARPADSLNGDALLLRRKPTLGETLDGLPGVAAGGFSPQSSRPVIRGMDGDRIRLLDNGGAQIDASSLSFDHAPAIDPLAVERVEVLRGPAALLYGGSAVGGVVNTLDNRIPRSPLQGLSGRAEVRLGGAAAERGAAALLEGGAGGWNWHVDAFDRRTRDLRVPSYEPVEADGTVLQATKRVRNSSGHARGGAVGASWADADGHLGLSLQTLRNDYGTTVEPDVSIGMQRDRLALSAERRRLPGPFSEVSLDGSFTDYRHQEFAGGSPETLFTAKGGDWRLQARHRVVETGFGALHGALGLQTERLDFAALGDEAFVPSTRTRSVAAFLLEELHLGAPTLSLGLRREQVRVASAGDPGGAPQFGAASERRFSPGSASLGLDWPLDSLVGKGWALQASLGRSERAPAYYELYANGEHAATGSIEIGDPALQAERSRHAEVGLHWHGGGSDFKLQLFETRFSNYIALAYGGVDGNGTPIYNFRALPARLRGVEIEGKHRLQLGTWRLNLDAGADLVRGEQRDTGEPLPRLAPVRLKLGVAAGQGPWRLGADLRHALAQRRFAAGDIETPSSTLLNLWLTRRATLAGTDALWFVRLDNVFDELAYNASAPRTVRQLSPLAGRALMAGVQVSF